MKTQRIHRYAQRKRKSCGRIIDKRNMNRWLYLI